MTSDLPGWAIAAIGLLGLAAGLGVIRWAARTQNPPESEGE